MGSTLLILTDGGSTLQGTLPNWWVNFADTKDCRHRVRHRFFAEFFESAAHNFAFANEGKVQGKPLRVAYVHDWLVTYRGGERVLEALIELYPHAPIFTLFYEPSEMPEALRSRQIIVSSWLNRLRKFRKLLLPLLPAAIEALPLEDYDLVISTSSCVAKGVIVGPYAKHLSYVHSPMRYIWDQRKHYLTPRREFSAKEALIHWIFQHLRLWDVSSNHGVDRFIANSSFVQARIKRFYGRDSGLIFPPVNVEQFAPKAAEKSDYFLVAGAMVSYKRFELAIEACQALGKRLVVAGSGPDEAKLRKIAHSSVEFHIRPTKAKWVELFQKAEAFIFPGVEDFGMTAIEAMAAGTPVIAFKGGGALDFIEPGKTGLFFTEDNVEALKEVLINFDGTKFSQQYLVNYAKSFSREHFIKQIRRELDALLKDGCA